MKGKLGYITICVLGLMLVLTLRAGLAQEPQEREEPRPGGRLPELALSERDDRQQTKPYLRPPLPPSAVSERLTWSLIQLNLLDTNKRFRGAAVSHPPETAVEETAPAIDWA